MEFEVGSLANLISGNKLGFNSKEKKLFKTIPSEKGIVKLKKVKNFKKSKWEIEETKNTSSGDDGTFLLDETNQKVKQRGKKKSIKPTHFNKYNETENEMKNELSNALSAKKRLKHKRKKEMETNNENKKECEIFVGNVPHDITKKKLIKLFKQYGKVESVRLRCAPLSDPRIPKKVAIITKKFHPDRNSMHAFVRFTEAEFAKRAVEANGMFFENHHLRVDLVASESQHDLKKAVFLGNVPFAAEEEDLWKIFEQCGNISSIRIIRDKFTGVGKGFAYINFENADAVELALKLDGTELNKRPIRVRRSIKKPLKVEVKKEKSGKVKKQRRLSDHKPVKIKFDSNEEIVSDELNGKKMEVFEEGQSNDANKEYINKKVKGHKVHGKLLKSKIKDKNVDDKTHLLDSLVFEKTKKCFDFNTAFQGQKTAEDKKLRKKKKRKINKAELKKMSMIRKLSSKSKLSMKKNTKPTLKIKSAAKKMKLKP